MIIKIVLKSYVQMYSPEMLCIVQVEYGLRGKAVLLVALFSLYFSYSNAFDSSYGITILKMMDGLDVTDNLHSAGLWFIQYDENGLTL